MTKSNLVIFGACSGCKFLPETGSGTKMTRKTILQWPSLFQNWPLVGSDVTQKLCSLRMRLSGKTQNVQILNKKAKYNIMTQN